MQQYAWPGNIRELRNVIERICIMKSGPELLAEHLPVEIRGNAAGIMVSSSGTFMVKGSVLPEGKGLDDAVMDFEKAIIRQALTLSKGNVLQTASRLKIPRGTLRYKMDKYGL
jgi:DNA-binding NtrC family response regulator